MDLPADSYYRNRMKYYSNSGMIKYKSLLQRNFNNSSGTTGTIIDDDGIISTDEDESLQPSDVASEPLLRLQRQSSDADSSSSIIQTFWSVLNPNNLKMRDYIPDEDIDSYFSSNEDLDSSDSTNLQRQSSSEILSNANTNAACSTRKVCRQLTFRQKLHILSRRILLLIVRIVLKVLKIIRNLLLLAYFIFVLAANLPYATLRNFVYFLKCFTGSRCLHLIPFRLPFALYDLLLSYIQASFVCKTNLCMKTCKSKCFNTSNSSTIGSSKSCLNSNENAFAKTKNTQCKGLYCTDTRRCLFFIAIAIVFACMFYCYEQPDSTMCKMSAVIQVLKSKCVEHFRGLYMFPGEECMQAGRCCRGYCEGFFRWMACGVTIPIRIILSAWPKPPMNINSLQNGMEGIRSYIDKIVEELNEVKEDMNKEEEFLLSIQTNFINLEQKVNEKSNSVVKLRPKLRRSTENIDALRTDVKQLLKALAQVVTLRNDADRLLESVRLEATDQAAVVRAAIIRLQTSIQAEQYRLHTQIENLGKLLKEDQSKNTERNERLLQRIETEISHHKTIQKDIKARLGPLQDLVVRYKELSDSLNKELRNKLNEEMVHHEQMSKRTEKFCLAGVEKLEADLVRARTDLTCFINKTLSYEANVLHGRLSKDVHATLYDRTVELSHKTVEQALANYMKKHKSQAPKKNIKKCSLFSHVFGVPDMGREDDDMGLCDDRSGRGSRANLLTGRGRVRDTVDEVIDEYLNQLAADSIAKADYALESSGGAVMARQSSETYSGRAALLSLFGVAFGKAVTSIRKVIQPGAMPGECWAFKGSQGQVTLRMARSVTVTSVSIDHVPRMLTPTGDTPSAPRQFRVHALMSPEEPNSFELGLFEYDRLGEPIQTFMVNETIQSQVGPVRFVRFNFLSNHGNDEYTCLYRLRVHGNISPDAE